MATERWLQAKGLPITNFDIQAKMYFLGWTLAPMVKMMRDDFYRDYFFDIVDMMRDQYYCDRGLSAFELRPRPALRLQGLLYRPAHRRRGTQAGEEKQLGRSLTCRKTLKESRP